MSIKKTIFDTSTIQKNDSLIKNFITTTSYQVTVTFDIPNPNGHIVIDISPNHINNVQKILLNTNLININIIDCQIVMKEKIITENSPNILLYGIVISKYDLKDTNTISLILSNISDPPKITVYVLNNDITEFVIINNDKNIYDLHPIMPDKHHISDDNKYQEIILDNHHISASNKYQDIILSNDLPININSDKIKSSAQYISNDDIAKENNDIINHQEKLKTTTQNKKKKHKKRCKKHKKNINGVKHHCKHNKELHKKENQDKIINTTEILNDCAIIKKINCHHSTQKRLCDECNLKYNYKCLVCGSNQFDQIYNNMYNKYCNICNNIIKDRKSIYKHDKKNDLIVLQYIINKYTCNKNLPIEEKMVDINTIQKIKNKYNL